MKKSCIYLRKSRAENGLEDLDKHKAILTKLAKDMNLEYDIYQEIGSSDSITNRVELGKILDNISEYDNILIMDWDRLSRNERDSAYISCILEENDVKVVTPSKIYDLRNDNDAMMGSFMKVLATNEYRMIKKRLRQGKMQSFNSGNWCNGSKFEFLPYKYNKETKSLEIDDTKIERYNYAKSLALEGYSCSSISRKLNINNCTLNIAFKNKIALGLIKHKGEYRKGKHPAVITESEYNKIQSYISKRRHKIINSKHHYPLSGLIRCSVCGYARTITRRVDRKNQEFITTCRCCKDNSLKSDRIHDQILIELKKYIFMIKNGLQEDEKKEKLLKIKEEQKLLKKKITKDKNKIEKIKDMILEDILTVQEGKEKTLHLNEEIKNNEIELIALEDEYNDIKRKKKDVINYEEIVKVLENNRGNIEDKDLNTLYRAFIDCIIIKEKQIQEIVFK